MATAKSGFKAVALGAKDPREKQSVSLVLLVQFVKSLDVGGKWRQ